MPFRLCLRISDGKESPQVVFVGKVGLPVVLRLTIRTDMVVPVVLRLAIRISVLSRLCPRWRSLRDLAKKRKPGKKAKVGRQATHSEDRPTYWC